MDVFTVKAIELCRIGNNERLLAEKGYSSKVFNMNAIELYFYCVKDPPPPEFSERWLYTKSYCLKVKFLRGQFLTKKLSVPGGNFSNYFMKILVFSQLYRSKSATLEIAYDMKIDFLLYNLYFPLNQQSAKTIRTYIQI